MVDKFDPDSYLEDFNPDEYISSKEEGPSRLEALLSGAAQGTTFGLDKALAGASAVAGHLVGRDTEAEEQLRQQGIEPQSLGDIYKEAKEAYGKEQEQLMSERPGAFLGGNVAGSILTGAAIPKLLVAKGADKITKADTAIKAIEANKMRDLETKLQMIKDLKNFKAAQRIKGATEIGAKAGGLYGLSSGETELIGSDKSIPEQAIGLVSDVAKGTIGGAIGGAAFGGVTEVVPAAFRNIKPLEDIATTFREAGENIGDKALKLYRKKLLDYSKDFTNKLETSRKEIGSNLGEIRANLKSTYDMNTRVQPIIDTLNSKNYTGRAAKERDAIVGELEEILNKNASHEKAMQKAEEKLMKSNVKEGMEKPVSSIQEGIEEQTKIPYVGVEDKKGRVSAIPFEKQPEVDVSQMPISDVESKLSQIRSLINSRGQPIENEEIKNVLTGLAKELKGDITKIADTEVGGDKYSKLNELYRQRKETQKLLGLEKSREDSQTDMAKKSLNFAQKLEADSSKFENILDEYKNIESKMGNLPETISDVSKRQDILDKLNLAKQSTREVEATEGKLKALFGGIKPLALQVAGAAGKAKQSIENKIPIKAFGNTKTLTNDFINDIANKLEEKGHKQFVDELRKIVQTTDKNKRSALLHGLMGQPAFRDIMNTLGSLPVEMGKTIVE